jgi:hypothetical protein
LSVNLFRPFDDAFTALWNKTAGSIPNGKTLEKQLHDVLPQYLEQDPQLTDGHTNQQWLRTTVWQLTNGVLNHGGDDGAMSFQFPIDIAREMLLSMASHFRGQSMELLGSGLVRFVDLSRLRFKLTDKFLRSRSFWKSPLR